MKHIPLTLFCLSLLVGCEDDERTELEAERQRAEQAEEERKQAEEARNAAEKAREEAEANKSTWQTVAGLSGIGAVGLLFWGTALGSAARKESENSNNNFNE